MPTLAGMIQEREPQEPQEKPTTLAGMIQTRSPVTMPPPKPADTFDYLANVGGEVREIMPNVFIQDKWDKLQASVEDPKGFQDNLVADAFLASVTLANPKFAHDARDQLSKALFRKPITPSQLVPQVLKNEKMIERYATSWNELAKRRRLSKMGVVERGLKQFANKAILEDIDRARPSSGAIHAVSGILAWQEEADRMGLPSVGEKVTFWEGLKAVPKLIASGWLAALRPKHRAKAVAVQQALEAERGGVPFEVGPAETKGQKAVDITAGLGAFIGKILIAKKLVPPGTVLSDAVAWEVVSQSEGGVPGEGAMMSGALGAIGKAGISTPAKLASQSALFGSLTASQGGDLEDILISAGIPVLLHSARIAGKRISTWGDFQKRFPTFAGRVDPKGKDPTARKEAMDAYRTYQANPGDVKAEASWRAVTAKYGGAGSVSGEAAVAAAEQRATGKPGPRTPLTTPRTSLEKRSEPAPLTVGQTPEQIRLLRVAAAQGDLTEEMVKGLEEQVVAQETAEKKASEPAKAPQAPPAAITPEEGAVGGVGEKQPWEMTRDAFAEVGLRNNYWQREGKWYTAIEGKETIVPDSEINRLKEELFVGSHPMRVQEAVERGESVPRNVLEEYKGQEWADAALAKLPAPAAGVGEKAIESEYSTTLDNLKEEMGDKAYFDKRLKALREKEPQEVRDAYRSQHPEGPAILYKPGSDRGAMIAPSTRTPGKYQVTWFDERGLSGHIEANTEVKAFGEAYKEHYSVPDPVRGAKQMASKKFVEGVKEVEKIQAEHRKIMEAIHAKAKKETAVKPAPSAKIDKGEAGKPVLVTPEGLVGAKPTDQSVEIETGIEGVTLWSKPGSEATTKAIAKKMAKIKGKVAQQPEVMPSGVSEPLGGRKTPKAKALPKPKTKTGDIVAAINVAALPELEYNAEGKVSTRYSGLVGVKVEGDTMVSTDGRRLFVAKGDWGPDGIYTNKAGLKKGNLGTPDSEATFPKWKDIVPDYGTASIYVDDLETMWRRVRQAQLVVDPEAAAQQGILVLENPDGSLGFAGSNAETGHTEINIQRGAKVLGAVRPNLLLDAIGFHAKRGDKKIEFHFPKYDKPILTNSEDGKTSTVTMPIESDMTAAAKKAIDEQLGAVTLQAKAEDALSTAITAKDFDSLLDQLQLGNDINRQRFEEITGVQLPDTKAGTENVIGQFVSGKPPTYRRQKGGTTLIPDVASELNSVARRTTGGASQLVGNALTMFRRNFKMATTYMRELGGSGKLIANDLDTITHAHTKQSNNDLLDLRKALKGLNTGQRERAAMLTNERIKADSPKIQQASENMRTIMDREMNEAAGLGMPRNVRGKKIPMAGSGKAFPESPNAKGVAFLDEANAKGKASSRVFAWAQGQVNAERFKTVDEAIIALQQYREQQLRAVNSYFESTRVELPVDMIEWDPAKVLPHAIHRNWMTIEGVRQWGVDEQGQSFPKLRSRLERIRRDFGADAAQRVETYITTSFGGPNPASQQAIKISNQVRGYQFITKVGSSAATILRNMFDRLPKAATISPMGTLRALKDYPPFINAFIESSQKLEERMIRAGAVFGHGSLSEGYEAGSFFGELMSAPFSESERGNQVFIAAVAYDKLMHDIAILEKHGVDVSDRVIGAVAKVFGLHPAQAAYRIGPEITAKVLAGEEVSQNDIDAFLADAVSRNAFPMLLNTATIWYNTHPFMKALAQFKTWPVRQTNMIWEDVLKYTAKTGDPTKIVKFIIATIIAGELYNIIRDFLWDKDESALAQLRKDAEGRQIALALLNDLVDGGGVGMIADLTYGIKDWAAGVSVRTGKNLGAFFRYAWESPRLTPQAAEKLLSQEVTPYRQIKSLINKVDAKLDKDNITHDFYTTRSEAWRWKEWQDNPTAISQASAMTEEIIWGQPDYGIGERTLAYELAARQIVAGDIEDAAKYLRYVLKNADDPKQVLAGIKISMDAKSPLGPIKKSDRWEFLNSLSPTEAEEARQVQTRYLTNYGKALEYAYKTRK